MAKTPTSAIGIDLGRYSLKGVLLQRKGAKYALTHYAVHVRTDDGTDSAENLAGQLKELFSKMGGRAVACGVGVSRGDALLRIIEQPQTPPEILREAVKLNGMSLLNQDVKEFVLDCDEIESAAPQAAAPGANPQRKYVVGGLPRLSIAQIDDAFQSARGPLNALQLAPICTFNAFEFARPEVFNENSFVLVDIGHSATQVLVGVKKELVLVRAVEFGGKALLDALTGGGNVADPKSVFDMLDRGEETLVYHARNALLYLAREISSSIGFFEARHEETISKIYVSGATARNSVLALLTEELQIPCEMWNPFASCEVQLGGKEAQFQTDLPSLNVACGAAAELLRGA